MAKPGFMPIVIAMAVTLGGEYISATSSLPGWCVLGLWIGEIIAIMVI